MTTEDNSDDDIVAPGPEGAPRPAGQRRSILDDAYGAAGLPKPRMPIGRDFLDEDLPPLTDPLVPSPKRESYLDRDLDRDLDLLRKQPDVRQQPTEPSRAEHRIRDPLPGAAPRAAQVATDRLRDTGTEQRDREGNAASVAPRTGSRHSTLVSKAPSPLPSTTVDHTEDKGADQPKRNGILFAAIAAVALLAVGGGGAWYWMQSNNSASVKPDSQATAANPAPAASPVGQPIRNAFYEQIEKSGIQACGRVFSGLGHVATIGSSYSIQASWNKEIPSSHGIFAVTGLSYDRPELKTFGAAMIFAAPVPGGCEGTAVRVITLPSSCATVAESQLPPDTTRSDDLSGVTLYDLAKGSGKLMLLPASENACAVVTIALGEN